MKFTNELYNDLLHIGSIVEEDNMSTPTHVLHDKEYRLERLAYRLWIALWILEIPVSVDSNEQIFSELKLIKLL